MRKRHNKKVRKNQGLTRDGIYLDLLLNSKEAQIMANPITVELQQVYGRVAR